MDKNTKKTINELLRKYAWIYQMEDGNGGIVIGESEEDVINEFKKEYGVDDISLRLEAYKNCGKSKEKWNKDNHNPYDWGFSLVYFTDYNYENESNVYIIFPA